MDPLVEFILARHIDSYQKLFFILFLYQHPDVQGTSQEFGARLHLGNIPLIEEMLADLQDAGLVDKVERGFKLHAGAATNPELRRLVQAFEDPLNRQQLLDHVCHY